MPGELPVYLTEEEIIALLNGLVNTASGGRFTTFQSFVAVLSSLVGIDREGIREVLATSILRRSNELMGQDELVKIMSREIFRDIVANQSGDDVMFDTVDDEDAGINFGKYFVED